MRYYWNGYLVTPAQAVALEEIGETVTTDPDEWFWDLW